MASKEYIERLKMTVEHLYKCSERHLRTERVTEDFQGPTLWSGAVESFELSGYPKASRCYGWSQGKPVLRLVTRQAREVYYDPRNAPHQIRR